jgi:hypothetical protein
MASKVKKGKFKIRNWIYCVKYIIFTNVAQFLDISVMLYPGEII